MCYGDLFQNGAEARSERGHGPALVINLGSGRSFKLQGWDVPSLRADLPTGFSTGAFDGAKANHAVSNCASITALILKSWVKALVMSDVALSSFTDVHE